MRSPILATRYKNLFVFGHLCLHGLHRKIICQFSRFLLHLSRIAISLGFIKSKYNFNIPRKASLVQEDLIPQSRLYTADIEKRPGASTGHMTPPVCIPIPSLASAFPGLADTRHVRTRSPSYLSISSWHCPASVRWLHADSPIHSGQIVAFLVIANLGCSGSRGTERLVRGGGRISLILVMISDSRASRSQTIFSFV